MTDGASALELAIAQLQAHPIVNALGEAATIEVRDGIITLAAPVGRLVVAPGQMIASAWGNAVADQSVMCFASVADRDNQYPAPHDGSVVYTIAEQRLWLRRGSWIPLNVDAALDYVSQGVPVYGGYTANRPVKVLSRRFTATGDANGFYTTPMPANVTAILSILATSETMAAATALVFMIRADVTNATQVVIQGRRGDTGAAIATVAATIHIRIEYQTT